MLREFKAFVMRGNLIELAVAFIMGVAFATVVTAFTNIVLGTIAYVAGGSTSFDDIGVEKDGVLVIPIGAFLAALVSFLIISFVLFVIVKAYNRTRPPTPVTTKACPFCASEINLIATRCSMCTAELPAAG